MKTPLYVAFVCLNNRIKIIFHPLFSGWSHPEHRVLLLLNPSFGSRTCGQNVTASSHCSAVRYVRCCLRSETTLTPTHHASVTLLQTSRGSKMRWKPYLMVLERSNVWSSSPSELLLSSELEDFGSGCSWPDRSVADWGRNGERKTEWQSQPQSINFRINFFVPLIIVKEPSIFTQSVRKITLTKHP